MKKNIFYSIIFFLMMIAGVFIFYIYYQEEYVVLKTDLISITLNNEYWTSEDVVVTVEYQNKDIKIDSYSFDGGKNWQDSNQYTTSDNQELEIMLKTKNGKKSKKIPYRIENIDKDNPTIEVDDIFYVAQGTPFTFDNKYKVKDATSGIRGKVQFEPSFIDTTEIGSYQVRVSVVDKALNSDSKRFTVEVLDPKDPHLKDLTEGGTISVTGLTLSATRLSLVKGSTTKVEAIVKPSGASNKNVIWQSTNENVATVENGVITALKPGSSTIRATTVDGEKTSEIRLVVTDQEVEVTKIELDRTSDTVTTAYGSITLIATVSPENATNPSVRWGSSNPNVAYVDSKGNITIRGEGTTTITATTSNNKTATYILTVIDNYTFQVKEFRTETGELMGYTIKIYQNGVDITNQVSDIMEPFTAQNKLKADEIEITMGNYALLKNSITFRVNGKKHNATK